MDDVVYQRRNENGLARPRQSGNAQPNGWSHQIAGEIGDVVERDQRIIGKCRDSGQTGIRAPRVDGLSTRPFFHIW